jgi:conserved hypothetical protein
MKSIIGVRFYSALNLGDDLFIYILSRRYGENNILTYNQKIPSSLDKIYVLPRYKYIFFRALEKITRKNFLDIWLSRSSEIYVYIGGSIFIENNNLQKWEEETRFYRDLSIPYYILGSNFGPYKNPKFVGIVRDIVSGAQDVCFRDKASYELFRDIPSVRVATDIAFTLNTGMFESVPKQTKTVIISVIDAYSRFDEVTADRYEREIVNLSRQLVKDGYKVTLMSFCKYEGDEIAAQRILGKMGKKLQESVSSYSYTGDINEALGVLSRSEIIVASRFHAAVLGLVFGKKILPIVYSDKTLNILRDLDFDGPIFDIREIDKLSGRKFDISNLKSNDVSRQKKLAEKQFQELDKILEKRK